jgi:hypothetical protein
MKPTHLAAVASTAAAAAFGAYLAAGQSDSTAVAAAGASPTAATAATPVAARTAGPARPDPGTASLADRLGVGEERLRARPRGPAPRAPLPVGRA